MRTVFVAAALLLSTQTTNATVDIDRSPCAAMIEYIHEVRDTQKQLLNEFNQTTMALVYVQLSGADKPNNGQISIPARTERLGEYGHSLSLQTKLLHELLPLMASCAK